jgi:hypothetical protein
MGHAESVQGIIKAEAGMSRKQYKSAPGRLARLFESSRDRWKGRAAQKQRTIRAQRVTIRDLKASRDYWKAQALETARQRDALLAAAPAGAGLSCLPGGPCPGGA